MKTFLEVVKIETKLMIRSINTIFFGIGFPAVVAIFMGILINDKTTFNMMFGAISTIGICATGLMGLPLAIADYRHKKVLKRYFVTPISPSLILLVQGIINYITAVVSLFIVYGIMNMGFGFTLKGSWVVFLASFTLLTFSMYGIGFMIASISKNMKIANLLATITYFPMLLLSGAMIPYSLMPSLLQNVMNVMPLRHGIDLLNATSLSLPLDTTGPIFILLSIGIVCTGISIKYFKWQ